MSDQSNLIERLKSLAQQECWGDIIYDDDDDIQWKNAELLKQTV